MTTIAVLERELYTIPEAARLLRVPASTLRWWLEGRGRYAPVIRVEPTGSSNVTWGEFIEAGFLREYRKRNVALQKLRPVIAKLREGFAIPYPLAHFKPFIGPGPKLVLEAQRSARLPEELAIYHEVTTGQLVLDGRFESFLERVDFSEDGPRIALRLHPAGKDVPVVIDPAAGFGAPTVRGIRTEIIAELVNAGESPEAVAEDYGLELDDLRAALAYEWQPRAA